MNEPQSHAEDCADILKQDLAAGRISRRDFVAALAALGAVSALPKRAGAQAGELVIANWGGDAVRHFGTAFGQVVEQKTGRKLTVDGGGPSMGRIRTMVQARNTVWDVCDSGAGDSLELGRLGMLEPIDYDIVDRNKMLPEFAYPHGCANYMFGVVLAYDRRRYGDNPPTRLADFWDLQKFPGRRLLRKQALAMLEMALIADGVPFEQIYPIDIDRALRKLRPLARDALFWANGTESQQHLRDGECSMGLIWHTRANLLKRETNGRIDWTFNQGILFPGIWIVPKGNPAGAKTAMEAIAAMQDPAAQVKLLELMGNGPANPAARELVPAELRSVDPGLAADRMLRSNGRWWGENTTIAEQKYADMIGT